MSEYIIEIKEYNKFIKNNAILKNININLEKGKCYGFVGTNGSGKSMLFKAICGLIKSNEGYIKVNGKIIGKDVDFPSNVGALIEYPGFLGNFSGLQNLKYLAAINNKITDEEIIKFMVLLDLDPNDKKKVKNYSLGMKQRLGIIQAIMENPSIVILDEPMNALDKNGIDLVRGIIKNMKSQGKTILLASHNVMDINLLCDEIFEFNLGVLEKINS
ncbi:ATP-binding cassette domain-containing protein [Clostridium perfringens]|uniref:ABC transporter n=1 Tax=Clostridium perfringens TaxID=1502 RepID=A0A2X3CJ24_CLOPF|nr:ATP-binding cassette domain-containing protein [Clostridium perfringens]EJT5917585.1 ATP-binding cassette domain-containing protein [Clostridium perfringens]EJT5939963.1 ATP-binding cassette domain-containing protein [Clostridium perfringens]EJT6136276.1 ATP-binding cassette domain-containing protein [Clostridium perfringens]EJT6472016.1 ATP-binding cassette domain-containing protein [Clostridium perfringens]MDC4251733.1 ATP-binding cassette domain-containing protein [Clostridium perfringen